MHDTTAGVESSVKCLDVAQAVDASEDDQKAARTRMYTLAIRTCCNTHGHGNREPVYLWFVVFGASVVGACCMCVYAGLCRFLGVCVCGVCIRCSCMQCVQLLAGTGHMGFLTSGFCSPSPTPSGLLRAPLTVYVLDTRVSLPISIVYISQTHSSITKT